MIRQYLNKIICGDCLEVMREMPSESVDLVVTSPPYNIGGARYGNMWPNAALQHGYSHYDDNMPHDEYADWQYECLKEMYRLIKKDGAIFYNHKWRIQGLLLMDRRDIIRDLPVRQIIIWKRKGGINFNDKFFLPTYEVIYLIAKDKFKLVRGANTYGDVWEFTQEMNNDHPAPFPVALIDRIISSTKAKIVLDPFMGSGTTAMAALGLNRNYIGIDISPDYCKMAEDRIAEYESQPKLFSSEEVTQLNLFENIEK